MYCNPIRSHKNSSYFVHFQRSYDLMQSHDFYPTRIHTSFRNVMQIVAGFEDTLQRLYLRSNPVYYTLARSLKSVSPTPATWPHLFLSSVSPTHIRYLSTHLYILFLIYLSTFLFRPTPRDPFKKSSISVFRALFPLSTSSQYSFCWAICSAKGSASRR